MQHTEPEQASKEESDEKQSKANGELRLLADGGLERLAGGGLPDIVERCCRHMVFFQRVCASCCQVLMSGRCRCSLEFESHEVRPASLLQLPSLRFHRPRGRIHVMRRCRLELRAGSPPLTFSSHITRLRLPTDQHLGDSKMAQGVIKQEESKSTHVQLQMYQYGHVFDCD